MIYSPPEIVAKKRLQSDPKIDVWSLGVILYILLTKEYPFKGNTEYKTFKSIIKDPLKFPKSVSLSKEVRHLLNRMLDKNPYTRYNIDDVKIHPWMQGQFGDIEGKRFYEVIGMSSCILRYSD